MSVVSFIRTAGVATECSNTPRCVSVSADDAESNMTSTRPDSVIVVMASRYSGLVLSVPSGFGPGAWSPKAMSPSLASATMKSAGV